MARPAKQGLDYFDLSVDFFEDDKIALTEAKFGIKGSYIALRLIAKLYRFGFYLQWGDDEAALFARSVGNGIHASLAKDVVDELVKRGFFDETIFNSFHVLTSRGIQTRYFNAVKRRTPVTVDARYLLIDVSKIDNVNVMRAETGLLHTETELLHTESTQSRVDKRRVEKSREETSPSPPLADKRRAGGSVSRGGGFNWFVSVENNTIRTMLSRAGVSDNDAWEFLRLMSAPEVPDGYALSVAEKYCAGSAEERKEHPFFLIIQAHQSYEEQKRINPMPYREFQTRLFLNRNCLGSDQATITAMADSDPRLFDELQKAVAEILRPGSNILHPGKYIIAQLRKLQSTLNHQRLIK